MKKVTYKQKLVFEAIDKFINEYGYSPTYREIGEMINMDVRGVFDKCIVLEELGYIKTCLGKQRTIRILKDLKYD